MGSIPASRATFPHLEIRAFRAKRCIEGCSAAMLRAPRSTLAAITLRSVRTKKTLTEVSVLRVGCAGKI
ncbi:hypothetical protein ACPWT1_05275 [Ramlibacter sp. MMS24-I3-19]|uniref:hypothetical protein n=1 Tax=Ramlibacter sp. MMS24-I3-19 TaxID=3416606 RepID=UPI003D062EC7